MDDNDKIKLGKISNTIGGLLTKMSWDMNFDEDTQRHFRLEIREELNKINKMIPDSCNCGLTLEEIESAIGIIKEGVGMERKPLVYCTHCKDVAGHAAIEKILRLEEELVCERRTVEILKELIAKYERFRLIAKKSFDTLRELGF